MNANVFLKRKAFTMIELVFVIVVLGILAVVAIPRFAATRDDAQIAKGRSDVAAIRAAIVNERQTRLLKGDSSYINKLNSSDTSLFDGNGTGALDGKLLQYAITAQDTNGHWHTPNCDNATPATCTYKYKIMNTDMTFTYKQADGTFMCTNGAYCSQLTN